MFAIVLIWQRHTHKLPVRCFPHTMMLTVFAQSFACAKCLPPLNRLDKHQIAIQHTHVCGLEVSFQGKHKR